MSSRKFALLFLLALVVAPTEVMADTLQFDFVKGIITTSFAPGGIITNDPTTPTHNQFIPTPSTLTAARHNPAGTQLTGLNLGKVIFTTGTFLSSTKNGSNQVINAIYNPGGSIIVTAAAGAFTGIAGGTTLFSGTFTSTQDLHSNTNNPNGVGNFFTLNGSVVTNSLNPTLLALLGLPFQPNGKFASIDFDISLRFNGGRVVSGSITLVPEPATLSLLGTGLVGLAGLLRRRKKS